MSLIEVEALEVSVPTRAAWRVLLPEVTFKVEEGEILGVCGHSGCGKSRLMALLSGQVAPRAGRLERARRTLLVPQDAPVLPWLTVRAHLSLGVQGDRNDPSAREIASALCIEHLFDARCWKLSGGERRRVLVGMALMAHPDVMILDESLASIDVATAIEVEHVIRRFSKERASACIVVSHDIDQIARFCDRVLLLASTPRPAIAQWDIELDGRSSQAIREWMRGSDAQTRP
jgi:nitrate/nitrite transport system ATP-binding protein